MGKIDKPRVKVEAYGLAKARKALGLTGAELAALTGKQKHYLYMLEGLTRSPSPALQAAILEHLPGYAWGDVFRYVVLLPEDLPTDTLYIEHSGNGLKVVSLDGVGAEEVRAH